MPDHPSFFQLQRIVDKGVRVLLIEDNPGDARLVKEMLRDSAENQFMLVHARTLSEGIALIGSEYFHVILSDLSLPDATGMETVSRLCASVSHLPIIILTGLDDERIALQALQKGVQDYLMKGHMDAHLLSRAIRYAMERKFQESALRQSESEMKLLMDASDLGILLIDANTHTILYANRPAVRLIGFPTEQIIGSSCHQLVCAAEKGACPVSAFGQTVERAESMLHTAQGVQLPTVKTVRPIDIGGRRCLIESFFDISDRKEMEDALRRSEERYRTILDSVEIGYYEADLHGNLNFFNDTFHMLLGYSREQIMGKNFRELVDPQTASEVYRIYKEVFATGKSVLMTEWEKCLQGVDKSFELGSFLIHNADRRPIGFRGVIRDVTERKQMEKSLKTAEELYRSLSNNSQMGVFITQNEKIVFLNPRVEAVTGYSEQEIFGMDPMSMVYEADREFSRQMDARVLAGNTIKPYEYRIVTKGGEIRWVMQTATPIMFKNRPAILASAMDITELKELKDIESSVLSAIPHAVFYLRDRNILFASDSVESVFGWKPDEIIGKSITLIYRTPEEFEAAGQTLYAGLSERKTATMELENPCVHRNGKELVCRLTAARVGDALTDGRIVAVYEDISEQKSAALRLLQSEKMASIGQLAAGVAHEINNPTGYVSSNLNTMTRYFDDTRTVIEAYRSLLGQLESFLDDAPREILGVSVKQIRNLEQEIELDYILDDGKALLGESIEGAERIRSIVLDLKNFAHPGTDKMNYVDLNKCIESTLNIAWNEIKYKATVSKYFSPLPPVLCNSQQINQVLMNLFLNAAQSIEKRGQIDISTHGINGEVEIRVKDNGSGIAPEHLRKIFDPFFTTKEVGKGTGLGLNVAYNLIQKHGGTIDVNSQVGVGTIFTIRLPVHGRSDEVHE